MRILLALFAALLLLSVGSGATASTSAPPQNGLIAVNGWEGIYIVDPQAGTTKLVPKTDEMSDPAWSPDGTTLAVSARYGESSAVYTMKPDGSERKLVLENAYSPSWSPNGKQLVVVRESAADGDEDGNELAIVDADGSGARTLDLVSAEGLQFVAVPEWSPNGKLIAFVDVGQGTIRFVSPDGEAATTPPVAADSGLSWSPDSTKLAFERYVEAKDGSRSVAVVLDLATGREAIFKGEQHGVRSPAWSPEGDQVAFLSMSKRATSTTTTTTSHSCGGEDAMSQLWVMSPDGTKANQLVKGEYYGQVSWARALEAEGAPPADTEQQPLPAPPSDTTPEPLPLPAPAPSEDAAPDVAKPSPVSTKRPAPSAATDGLIAVRGSDALYRTNPDGGSTQKIPDTSDMVAPAWSPDAKLLAVERVGKGGEQHLDDQAGRHRPATRASERLVALVVARGRPDLRRAERVRRLVRAGRRGCQRPLQRPCRRKGRPEGRSRRGCRSRVRMGSGRRCDRLLRRRERVGPRHIRLVGRDLVAGRVLGRVRRLRRSVRRRDRHCSAAIRPLARFRRWRHASAPGQGRLGPPLLG